MIDPDIFKIYSRIQQGEPPLRVIREALDMSQQEFATYIGVSTTSVSRWERRTSEMTLTLKQFRKLTELLRRVGLSIDTLINHADSSK